MHRPASAERHLDARCTYAVPIAAADYNHAAATRSRKPSSGMRSRDAFPTSSNLPDANPAFRDVAEIGLRFRKGIVVRQAHCILRVHVIEIVRFGGDMSQRTEKLLLAVAAAGWLCSQWAVAGQTVMVNDFGDSLNIYNDADQKACGIRKAAQVIANGSTAGYPSCETQTKSSTENKIVLPAGAMKLVDEISLATDLTIEGIDASKIDRPEDVTSTVVAGGTSRVFVTNSWNTTLAAVAITGGNVEAGTNGTGGAGIWAKGSGRLLLDRVWIHDNKAKRGGGMLITNAEVWIRHSLLENNAATGTTANVVPPASGGGAIMQEGGSLFVTGSLEEVAPYDPALLIEERVDASALNATLPVAAYLNDGPHVFSVFRRNYSHTHGAHLLKSGGNTFVSGTHLTEGMAMRPNQIVNGPTSDGSVWVGGGARTVLLRNTFSYNDVLGRGAGVHVEVGAGDVLISENTFRLNNAWIWSGASMEWSGNTSHCGIVSKAGDTGSLLITANTFHANQVPCGTVLLQDTGDAPVLISNNFFWGNLHNLLPIAAVSATSSGKLVPKTLEPAGAPAWPGITMTLSGSIQSPSSGNDISLQILHNTIYDDSGASAIQFEPGVEGLFGANLILLGATSFGFTSSMLPCSGSSVGAMGFLDNIEWNMTNTAMPISSCFNLATAPPGTSLNQQSELLALKASAPKCYGPNQECFAVITHPLQYDAIFRSRFAPLVDRLDQRRAMRPIYDPSVIPGNTVGSIEIPHLIEPPGPALR